MCTHLKTLLKYMKQKLLVKIDVTQTPTLEPGEVVPLSGSSSLQLTAAPEPELSR